MSRIRTVLNGLISSRSGNIAPLAALMFPMVLLMMGGAMDYIQAGRRQEALQGISDAAALSALTPAMMATTDAAATTTAENLFNGQAALITGIGAVTYTTGSCTANCYTISVTDTPSGATVLRTSTVTFLSTSTNVFSKLLGFSSTIIGGSSTAKNNLAPATNFYLLVDTSGSMGIAGNPTDISTLSTYTSAQGGCAFSCHESDPTADTDDALYNPASVPCTNTSSAYGASYTANVGFTSVGTHSGTAYGAEDNYALARCLGLTLRIDLVNQAVTNLLSTAPATAIKNNTTYGAAIYTFDYTPTALHVLWPTGETYLSNPTQFQTDMQNFTAAASAAGTLQQLEIYKNNNVTSSTNNNDEDTWTDEALTLINGLMPSPGQGTGAAGDTPKEVLFLITDGVEDYVFSGNRSYGPMNTNIPTGQATDFCSTIKNRGIRIAVLYLTYNPLDSGGTSGGSWYDRYIAPIQSEIQPAAQNCASAGLYSEVNSGGDVTSALANLFQQAVETAYLSH